MDKSKRGILLLVIGFILPIGAWGVQLLASYTIADYACNQEQEWLFHLISLICFLTCVFSLFITDMIIKKSEKKRLSRTIFYFDLLMAFIIVIADLGNYLLKLCQ